MIAVTGKLGFELEVTRPPFHAAQEVAAGAFAFIEITLCIAGAGKQPPVIRNWRAIERGVPVQVVRTADGVIGVQTLARIEAKLGHMMNRSEPVQTTGTAIDRCASKHVVGQ